jgi:hypothetical protein
MAGQRRPRSRAPASHVPPVPTRTWFRTGVHGGGGHVSDFYAGLLDEHDSGAYYRPPGYSDAQARAQRPTTTSRPSTR